MTIPSVFATTTALPENASDQYARTTYFGKGNTTEDTTLTERSTVIGSLNTIKRATDMTTIIGDSNSVDGKNNTVIGSINIVQGHDSVVIGAGAQAGASVVPDGDDAPLLTLGSAEGHGVTVIGTNAWANTEYASAIGYAAQSLGKNSIALGSYSDAGEMHAADSKYAGVSNNKGVLSIGAKDPSSTINYSNPTVNEPWANDFTRQIQHVSAGEVSATSTDAINGSQLQDAFDRSATNATNITTNAANAIKANADAIKAHDIAIDTLKGDVVKAKTTLTAGNGTIVTTTTNPNGSTNYTLGLDKVVTNQIDNNSKGIQANAEAIKDLAKANNALATETAKGLSGLNGRVDSLASKVDANQKEARRGIASASALSALHPLDYNPEHKVDVMAGVGHYRGNTAVALGAAYRPNENVMFTVGASINGKDSAINAGVSYKVGTKDGVDYKYSKVAMQRHIDELDTTVAEQNAKIEQLNSLVEKLLEEVHQSK